MRTFHHETPAWRHVVSVCRCALWAAVSCTLFATCGQLLAQTGGTGAISGAITDPAAALVVGARITVTDVATGYTRTTQTNDHGQYLASLLPPGRYTLNVTKAGFSPAKSANVQVILAETTVVNIRLLTGKVTETITVGASDVQLETESSQQGRVTDSEMVENLPLVTRNYTQIIGLNPGVAQALNNAGDLGRGGGAQGTLPGGGSVMSQGATSADNNFEMNGLPVNDAENSGIYSAGIPVPNPDTIEEFRVQTGQYDATSGRDAGADVDVITKGGTNEYHATVFEFFRNEDLNANDWFAKRQGQARPELRQNQYGFTAGGPLIKDKVLLFGSFQGTQQINALDPSTNHEDELPPLTNDRSYAALLNVFNGDYGYLGDFPGDIVGPGSNNGTNISPQAYALLNAKLPNGQYVVPTSQSVDTSKPLEVQGSSFLSQPGTFNENQWMVNGDYLRSERNKISVRYFGALSTEEQTMLYSTYGFPLYMPERFDVASISDTYTLSSNLVNQFAIGMHRTFSNMYYKDAFTFSSLGMQPAASYQDGLPNIWILDTGFETGTTSAVSFLEDEYNVADSLSWVKGRHQLTFGGGYTFGRDDMQKFFFQGYVIPLTWADFLLGNANVDGTGYSNIYESFEGVGNLSRDWRYKDGDGFIQDNYVVSNRLTLNLGLRYEHIGDLGVADGMAGNIILADLDKAPPASGSDAGLLVASNYNGPTPLPAGVIRGSNTFGINGVGQNVWNPRIGFSWMLPGSDRFVLRGGAGAYHTFIQGQVMLQLAASQPFSQWSVTAGTYNVHASDANPFPATPNYPVFEPYPPTTSYTSDALDPNFRPPTTYHFSLGLQSKLPGGAIFDLGYAGARDLHQIMSGSINQASLASPQNPIYYDGGTTPITTNTAANAYERAPYVGYTTNSMYLLRTGAEAWYNALEASLSEQYKNRLEFQASYTWARLLTDVPGDTYGTQSGQPTGNQLDLHAGYGPDPFVRPQRFVLSAVYNLPGPPRSHRLLADTLGGWNLATVTVIQDGQQLAIDYTNENSAYGETNDRASFAAGCTAKNLPTSGSVGSRINNYVNRSCLTTPALLGPGEGAGFGDTPNGVLRGPDQTDVDLSLSKTVPIHWPNEGATVLFRADFFNALNHPNFADPDLEYTPTASAFGTITAMSTNPRVIQLSLKLGF